MAFKTSKIVPHAKDKLYAIVADVLRYPEFLPWIKAAEIFPKENNFFEAQLLISLHGIESKYRSEVYLKENSIETISKPDDVFKKLTSSWKFESLDENNTKIEFEMDFEFHSKLWQAAAGRFLEYAASTMIKAFEDRALELR